MDVSVLKNFLYQFCPAIKYCMPFKCILIILFFYKQMKFTQFVGLYVFLQTELHLQAETVVWEQLKQDVRQVAMTLDCVTQVLTEFFVF